ncbi:MAG: hypothetical protein ABW000_23110 [Actinoplanes sp.]
MTARWVPRGPAVIAAALFAALTFGAAGAAAGAWLGWRTANPVPSYAEGNAIAAQIAPGLRGVESSRRAAVFVHDWQEWSGPFDWLTGRKGYEPGGLRIWLQATDSAAAVQQGGANLDRLGWRIASAGREVRATKDGYAITLRAPDTTMLQVDYSWDEPAAVRPMAIAGGILGFMLGWLIVLRLQIANLGEPFPAKVKGFGLAGLIFLLPSTATTLFGRPTALWEGYVVFGLSPLAVIGGVLLAVASISRESSQS